MGINIKGLADGLKPILESMVDERTKALNAKITELETMTRARPALGGGEEKKVGFDAEKFSWSKAINAIKGMKVHGAESWNKHKAGYEREVFDAINKTLSTFDESAGGFFVTPELLDPIEFLRTGTVLDKLGVTRLDGLTGAPVKIARQSSSTTGYWVGEGSAVTLSTAGTDQIELYPKKAGAATKLNNELLRRNPKAADILAKQDIAEVLLRLIETSFFQGTGVSGQPLGLASLAGINTQSFSGATDITTWALLQKMMRDLEEDAQDNSIDDAVWVMHSLAWSKLTQIQTLPATGGGASRPALTQGNFAEKIPKTLNGLPVMICNQLAASTTSVIFLAKWKDTIRAGWGAPEMKVTDEGTTLQTSDQTQVTMFQEVDSNARHPVSVCTGTAFTY